MSTHSSGPLLSGLNEAAAKDLLRLVMDQSYNSIMLTTADPATAGPPIVYVNGAFTELTGFSAEEVIGKTPGILQGGNTDRNVLQRLAQDLSVGRPFHGSAINYRRDWSEFVMEWKVFPVRDAAGDITHFVAIQREAGQPGAVKQQEPSPAAAVNTSQSPTNSHGEIIMNTHIDIGIAEEKRYEIGMGLSRLLADSYTLYLKTHNFHWNVTGPLFDTLHRMFEEQYQELALAVDTLAERIRTLGLNAPGSYAQFSQLTVIEEETGTPPAEAMIRQLVSDHETVAATARSTLSTAEQANDAVSADLLTQRMQIHEKTAWMLRSLLG